MNQFFFGSSDRPLYGVHHPAAAGLYRDSAVLVCYPLGREYMRCHRALVRLCNDLARSGFHAMRFDYDGTGDSAGDGSDVDLDTWVSNVHVAAQELRDVSGVQKISLVGVRFGAAIAVCAAAGENSLDLLLMWDPITDGRKYVRQMSSLHAEFVTDLNRFPELGIDSAATSNDELFGMPFPQKLRESIEKLSLTSIDSLAAEKVVTIVTEDKPEYRSLLEHMRSFARSSAHLVIDEPATWDVLSDLGAVLTPHRLLQRIVSVAEGEIA